MHNFFFFSAMDYYIFLSVALSYKMSIFIISIILLFDLSLKVCLKKSLQCILHQMQQVHHHHFLSICLLRQSPPFEHQHYPESEEAFELSFFYLRLWVLGPNRTKYLTEKLRHRIFLSSLTMTSRCTSALTMVSMTLYRVSVRLQVWTPSNHSLR